MQLPRPEAREQQNSGLNYNIKILKLKDFDIEVIVCDFLSSSNLSACTRLDSVEVHLTPAIGHSDPLSPEKQY